MALAAFCQGAQEVRSYEEGRARVGEDGWVLLCYGADWDRLHDERWMRRQTAIRSASGNALLMYVPVWQNPSAEQRADSEAQLRGARLGEHPFRSLPCAILLDAQGHPYKVIDGEAFLRNVTGQLRNAQSQLRTRCELLRQAELETGAIRAQTLGRIWRLSIAPPPGLRDMMTQADPQDEAGIAAISPFDPWDFARHVHGLGWEQAKAELDRMQSLPLSNAERQAVLALRMGCVHFFQASAGAREVRELAAAINALGSSTPLAKASLRAAELWGRGLALAKGWQPGQLPRVQVPCEFAGGYHLSTPGTYRFTFIPSGGADELRVRGVVITDGERVVAQDLHECDMRHGEASIGNEYSLRVEHELTHPRVEVIFDQQNKVDTSGSIVVHYGSLEETDFTRLDTEVAEGLLLPDPVAKPGGAGQGDAKASESYITLPGGVSVGTLAPGETPSAAAPGADGSAPVAPPAAPGADGSAPGSGPAPEPPPAPVPGAAGQG